MIWLVIFPLIFLIVLNAANDLLIQEYDFNVTPTEKGLLYTYDCILKSTNSIYISGIWLESKMQAEYQIKNCNNSAFIMRHDRTETLLNQIQFSFFGIDNLYIVWNSQLLIDMLILDVKSLSLTSKNARLNQLIVENTNVKEFEVEKSQFKELTIQNCNVNSLVLSELNISTFGFRHSQVKSFVSEYVTGFWIEIRNNSFNDSVSKFQYGAANLSFTFEENQVSKGFLMSLWSPMVYIINNEFAEIDEDSMHFVADEVDVTDNKFDRLRNKSIHVWASTIFDFINNDVKRSDSFAFVTSSIASFIRNRFRVVFSDPLKFVSIKSMKQKEQGLVVKKNLINYIFDVDFPNVDYMDSVNTYIVLEENLIDCSCINYKYLKWISSSKKLNFLQAMFLNDNSCANYGKCRLLEVNATRICQKVFVCPRRGVKGLMESEGSQEGNKSCDRVLRPDKLLSLTLLLFSLLLRY